jgi:hypothetical protein
VDQIHHHVGSLVKQNDVSADQHVRALRGWRRQAAFQVYGNRLEPFLEAWREGTAAHELFFQSRWQTIFFGEPWWEIVLVLVIPPARRFTVAVLVVALVRIVIVSAFFMTLAVSISMALGDGEMGSEHEDSNAEGDYPFCRAHRFLLY